MKVRYKKKCNHFYIELKLYSTLDDAKFKNNNFYSCESVVGYLSKAQNTLSF